MIRLVAVDPAHFHAALVQKEMYARVDRRARVLAPFGPDLVAHLQRLVGFNTRPANPTAWEVNVHAGPDFLDRLASERPGDVVILAGCNARKIDYIERAIEAGMHVLADKPWVLFPKDLPRLRRALDLADERRLIAYDIMTERYEVTSIVQRELVRDEAVFGKPAPGSAEEPGIYVESVHYLKKLVAGAPLRRPSVFFDVAQQGEGLTDVGTHLVDLVMWILFPDEPIDANEDVRVLAARRWPAHLSRDDYRAVTGEDEFPFPLAPLVADDRLAYFCNNSVHYTLRGVHVKLDVLWGLEAPPGTGDSHRAVFRGSRSRVEIRQGAEEHFRPEVYVVPLDDPSSVRRELDRKLAALREPFPGIGSMDLGDRLRVTIPDSFRTGHEAHFGEVTRQFLRFVEGSDPMPSWEKSNMIAKYTVTTRGVAMGNEKG